MPAQSIYPRRRIIGAKGIFCSRCRRNRGSSPQVRGTHVIDALPWQYHPGHPRRCEGGASAGMLFRQTEVHPRGRGNINDYLHRTQGLGFILWVWGAPKGDIDKMWSGLSPRVRGLISESLLNRSPVHPRRCGKHNTNTKTRAFGLNPAGARTF